MGDIIFLFFNTYDKFLNYLEYIRNLRLKRKPYFLFFPEIYKLSEKFLN